MSEDTEPDGRTQSRRRFVKVGAALTTGALLAGCTGNGTSNGETPTETETTSGEEGTTERQSYTVSMAPVGDLTFEETPEKWSTYFPGYADMGVALGVADGLSAVGNKGRYHTFFYDELDEVSIEKSDLTELIGDGGIDKELYYELNNDVHLTDPEWLVKNSFFGLESADIEELTDTVAPFLGNTIFRRTDPWHSYRFYTMYEAFRIVAEVFQKEEQYQAFKAFHDDFIADIQADLPSADNRPNGLLCFAASNEPEKFSPYRLTDKGTNKKHFHDLGVSDSLSGTGIEGLSTSERGKIDYETMLEVDPETVFIRGHEPKTRAEFEDTVLSFMQEHPVASQLSAVEDGRVFRGGPIYQGPIQNLFLTERFATELYPDTFTDDRLFSRSKVADIVAGAY